MYKLIAVLVIVILGLSSCQIRPDPIRYGSDLCSYCHMTIVDKQFAAQLVTNKGRTKKFDAIECMVSFLKTEDKNDYAMFLITDFENPGDLIDATLSTYLISPSLPSPMGAFLSGFAHRNSAERIREENGGEILNWILLKSHLNNSHDMISH